MNKLIITLLALTFTACAVDSEPLPTCADIGCPIAPSGTGDMSRAWEPCTDAVCYCRTDDVTLTACTVDQTES